MLFKTKLKGQVGKQKGGSKKLEFSKRTTFKKKPFNRPLKGAYMLEKKGFWEGQLRRIDRYCRQLIRVHVGAFSMDLIS